MHGRPKHVARERQSRFDPVRPRELAVRLGSADEAGNRLNRQSGRDFAGGVAAEAVGDDEQPQRRIAEKAVFVDLPNGPRVTLPGPAVRGRGFERIAIICSRSRLS